MSQPSLDAVTQMVAEHAIARQIIAFARHNDAGEVDDLAAMFVANGSFARPTDPDNPVFGRDAIGAFFRGRPPRRARHVITNILVTVDMPSDATAHSTVTLYSGAHGAPPLIGHFDDVLVREHDGIWRFVSRRGSLAFLPTVT